MQTLRLIPLVLAVPAALLVAGCSDDPGFIECRDETSCRLEDGGRCLVNPGTGHQFCAYPDADCETGMRWSDLDVEEDISGECVAETTPAALMVVSMTPANDATMVGTSTSIVITFNNEIAEPTVTASSFVVSGPAGTVAGTYTVTPATPTVSFSPAARLDPTATYQVMLTTAIADVDGNALDAPFSASFTTRAAGWTSPAPIENAEGTDVTVFAVDIQAGHGAALWNTNDCSSICGAPHTLSAAIYESGGFGSPEILATSNDLNGVTASNRAIAVDDAGDAVAVWTQKGSSTTSVLSSRRAAGGTWSTPEPIETATSGTPSTAIVSSDSAGNAYVVWQRNDDGYVNVWANRYTAGTGWGTAAKLEQVNANTTQPAVIAREDGTGLAVWYQSGNVYYSRFSGGSWSVPDRVGAVNGNAGTLAPVLTLDSAGAVIAVWVASDAVKAARYNGAWTVPASINPAVGTGEGVPVRVAAAASTTGHAIAVWGQGTGAHHDLLQSTFDGASWGAAAPLESLAGDSINPSAAFGAGERAQVVWTQDASAFSVEQLAASGWQTPEPISNGFAGLTLYDDLQNVFVHVYTPGSGLRRLYAITFE